VGHTVAQMRLRIRNVWAWRRPFAGWERMGRSKGQTKRRRKLRRIRNDVCVEIKYTPRFPTWFFAGHAAHVSCPVCSKFEDSRTRALPRARLRRTTRVRLKYLFVRQQVRLNNWGIVGQRFAKLLPHSKIRQRLNLLSLSKSHYRQMATIRDLNIAGVVKVI